jgi:hypothetical protein
MLTPIPTTTCAGDGMGAAINVIKTMAASAARSKRNVCCIPFLYAQASGDYCSPLVGFIQAFVRARLPLELSVGLFATNASLCALDASPLRILKHLLVADQF